MKRAIVVGSGAGGATVAKELQGKFEVTILEAGHDFRPFSWTLPRLEQFKRTGLLFDARLIRFFFPTMNIRKTVDGMTLVRGIGVGGTTTIATGNGLRMDQGLRAIGINLDAEFAELCHEIPISTSHQSKWREVTTELFEICQELNLNPFPAPKMGTHQNCVHCGRCMFGCPAGVKWDSREFVTVALEKGARLLTGCRVERVVMRDRKAIGVEVRKAWSREFYSADVIVLAAGGFATPVILQNSGIPCEPHLFVDPVLCVAAEAKGVRQCYEIEMPFVVQQEGYIISPYFDYLSFFFNRAWKYPVNDVLSVMIKLADSNAGSISRHGVDKTLTDSDKRRLKQGVDTCKEILRRFGIKEHQMFLGTLNAGHPGGMLPLTEREADSLHSARLPENLYVADATLFPNSLGNPPILTIAAMAKRVATMCAQHWA